MKKVALVHDYLLKIGGAERVLRVLHDMFPSSPIYAVVYDEKFVKDFFGNCHGGSCYGLVRGSFLQKAPLFLRKNYKYFSFLFPLAIEQIDLPRFDVVISSCSAFCKGVITHPSTTHICYCHTPTRYLWDWAHPRTKLTNGGGVRRFLEGTVLHFLRFWDQQAARRVDYFIANSRHIAERIQKYYGRDAKVIYPPVEQLSALANKEERWEDYFLIVSQLRPYKQIDIAIEAFRKLGFPLIIIGEGSDKKRLMRFASGAKNIKFLGYKPDNIVAEYYKNCKVFIFPGEDDFGMTMVEAMLFGKPVLALRKGGAEEIVIEGVTGEFFDATHPVVLADGLRRVLCNFEQYSPTVIRKRAEKFSRERFENETLEFIKKHCTIE